MQRIISSIFIAFIAFYSLKVMAEIPLEHFSKDATYSQVKISPNGEYIAFISKVDGKNNLYVLELSSSKIISGISFNGDEQVGRYEWVNKQRLVAEKQYIQGWASIPTSYGELVGRNADGKRQRYLVGYNGEITGSAIRKATPLQGTSHILDPLVHDDDHMLIVTKPWTNVKEPRTIVYKVNVNNGHRKRVAGSPTKMGRFLTDHQGFVRAVVSTEDFINQSIHIRDKKNRQWRQLMLRNMSLTDITPWSFDQSGQHMLIAASKQGEPKGIYKVNLASGDVRKVFDDKVVSPSNVWLDPISKEVYAIELDDGYPSYSFLDPGSINSKTLKSLLLSIPNTQVHLVSKTKDGNQMIVYAWSDTEPGQYYLYDKKAKALKFLFASRRWIESEKMSGTKPISFPARDGQLIHGYLTLPRGKKAEKLPLVVLPHGGPYYVRDYWGFDPEVQLLASRGIAVLQVNFRGSSGYGLNFAHAGHREWGEGIQHDIIDGVKYVIEQGYINKDNMCIMGASFGGYSALQSAIIEPNMFKCAIGVMGVYDLPLLFETGDIAGISRGQNYLTKILGTDKTQLKAFSPTYNIEKLKAPVLVVHGGVDQRAPIEQAEALLEALKQADHPHQYVLLETEGHGFYKAEHRALYYKHVLAFLDKHLEL